MKYFAVFMWLRTHLSRFRGEVCFNDGIIYSIQPSPIEALGTTVKFGIREHNDTEQSGTSTLFPFGGFHTLRRQRTGREEFSKCLRK